jgi:hypothetical protein
LVRQEQLLHEDSPEQSLEREEESEEDEYREGHMSQLIDPSEVCHANPYEMMSWKELLDSKLALESEKRLMAICVGDKRESLHL